MKLFRIEKVEMYERESNQKSNGFIWDFRTTINRAIIWVNV